MSEPAGFRDFVVGRSPVLLRTAWLLTGDWYNAQDLVQVALVKTWRRWDSVRCQDDPEAYVRRVMANTYNTWWRRRWRNELPSRELPDRLVTLDQYAETDVRNVVREALATLTRRQRTALVLRFFDDLSVVETANIMDCSAGTVKSTTATALTKLRNSPLLDLSGKEYLDETSR